jgi:hypothetical protein
MTFSDFFNHLGDIKWLGVIVATVGTMAFGFIWYGPLFGKIWARATGQSMAGGTPQAGKLVATFVYLFVFNVGIAYLAPLDDVQHALVWGLVVGVLLISAALYAGVVWRKDSPTAFLIDVFHWWVAAAIAVYVQGLFL